MLAFIEGVKSMIGKGVEIVKGFVDRIRNLLPFSDAKVGPLSDLTESGRRMVQTFGTGVREAGVTIPSMVRPVLSGFRQPVAGGSCVRRRVRRRVRTRRRRGGGGVDFDRVDHDSYPGGRPGGDSPVLSGTLSATSCGQWLTSSTRRSAHSGEHTGFHVNPPGSPIRPRSG